MKVGDVSTAEITDATPAVLASHISLRGCQGPANMAACPTGDQGGGRPRLDRRAGGRPQGRRAARRRSRPLRPDDQRRPRQRARTVIQSAQAKGYRYVTDAAGLSAVPNASKPVLGLFNSEQHVAGVERPRCLAGKGNAPVACNENQRPANEPSLAAMTEQGDRPAREPQGVLPPGRGGLDRQAGPRHQRLRPARRDRRLRPGDRRRARLPAPPPGHAGRRHRRPLAHQPDRRRGRQPARACRPATRPTC